MSRTCSTCEEPIPPARLAAMPDATQCVPCLTADGDVPQVKRYDDYKEDGEEKDEVFFTKPDQYLDTVLKRNGGMRIPRFYLPHNEDMTLKG